MTKSGSSNVTLTHNNTITGGITLNAGSLVVGNNGALGSGTLTAGGGTLSTDSHGPYTVSNAINLASNLTVSGVSDLTLSGAMTGNGGIVKTGSNTLTLPTINQYSGGVTINGGQVNVGPTPPSTANSPLGSGTVDLDRDDPHAEPARLYEFRSGAVGTILQQRAGQRR